MVSDDRNLHPAFDIENDRALRFTFFFGSGRDRDTDIFFMSVDIITFLSYAVLRIAGFMIWFFFL